MAEDTLELKFDINTIEHLGVRMYSTLPPALAELISNAYDADAENVTVTLTETDGSPTSITVADDGCGMDEKEIKEKFLVIGRNRRDDGDEPSPKFDRRPTGKKGLGKLALFGLAKVIEVETRKDGLRNAFTLSYDDLMSSGDGSYRPTWTVRNEPSDSGDGTTLTLSELKRKSAFDQAGIARSLARIFLFDDNFKLDVEVPGKQTTTVTNKLKYEDFEPEFEWDIATLIPDGTDAEFATVKGEFLSAKKPISPQSGMRGITIFSRGKLVNTPEFFSESNSSHFYQYVTGYIEADFVDDLDEDVISTNRQSLNWGHPRMAEFRQFLQSIVAKVRSDWREKRKKAKEDQIEEATGIDRTKWMSHVPAEVREKAEVILNMLTSSSNGAAISPVAKALYDLVPSYPYFHWRHLHSEIQDAARTDYKRGDYYRAFIEAVKRYISLSRTKSGKVDGSDQGMVSSVYGHGSIIETTKGFLRPDGSAFHADTLKSIEEGQKFMSMGVVSGARNPISHEEVADLRDSKLFTEKDCLDALSILSHLMKRLDESTKRTP